MAHFLVEYSTNIESEMALPELFEKLIRVAAGTGVFPFGGLRARGLPRKQYRIADGHEDNAFVHVQFRVGSGREVETLRSAGEEIYAVLSDHLIGIFESRAMAISMEFVEIHPDLNFKMNNTHDYVKARAASS
jgi:5-carboxymethyl-2-hydroxymuconate isomerase